MTGYVGSAVPDGQGGWFIGGDFTAVGGTPRSSLAHILSDGSVSPWAPSQDAHSIGRMALSGGTLYVTGSFNVIDGQTRIRLAAFDVATGRLLPWNPNPSGAVGPYGGPNVVGLAVRNDTVFVGGNFTSIGGQPRVGLAALDGTTGLALGWYPGPVNDEVDALALSGNALYLGGYFTALAGQARSRAAAVDASTAAVLPWNPNITGPDDPYVGQPRVAVIAVRDSTLYVGGQFLSVHGKPRNALVAVDPDTGGVLPWNPAPAHPYSYPYPYVQSLAVQGDTIYVGGNFETIGGAQRISLAAIDAASGAATSWDPRPDVNHDVMALAVSDGVVYAGGTFPTLGPWKLRSCLAALDLTTGTVKDWDPAPNGLFVDALVVSHGTVYVGGDFTFIGGQPRSGIAALDTLTGAATQWNPESDGSITAMLLDGRTLYVAGGFGSIGGQVRHYVGALDTATARATPWDPDASDWVFALAKSAGTVYLGGLLQSVGHVPHRYLAAVDDSTGAPRPWQADADWVVDALAASGTTVFAGGEFSTINGEPRTRIAALDANTGALTRWDAHLSGAVSNPSPAVVALALSGHTLYLAGDFYSLGGQVRPCLAAVDDSVGMATAWAPRADFEAMSLSISGDKLYAGGGFGAIELLPCHGLAALSIPVDPPLVPARFGLAQNFPNPASAGTDIRFTLPTALIARLSIYDIQGRRVATPLESSLLLPGEHDVAVQVGAMRPGMYLYRLEAEGMTATRKMLVVR
ncbi:MAG TPA: PQQ-binding-like beta-propeller repeat protein [Candidatus Eisenbacteria bacterium]|nr:PQQ-binding-like beta-propeller repeat protein [Candidatus Eisenbacteria bacterium]